MISSRLAMTAAWFSVQPLLCGRIHIHRRKTCGILTSFLVLLILTTCLLNGNLRLSTEVIHDGENQPVRLKLQNKIAITNPRNTVFNPLQYMNSRTVGPKCDSFLLVVITSAPKNEGRRQAIRATWAQRNIYNDRYDWQYVFAIGRSQEPELQSQVATEMNLYNDILYADFLDSYRNLTIKVVNAMAWANYHCRGTKFVLKTDDDCYLNTIALPRLIQDYHPEDREVYLGKVFSKTRDLMVLRDKENQWSLSHDEYPLNFYPPYASGSGYLLSIDVIDAVLNRSRFIKPFPVEDAYLGVLLAAIGVEPIHSGRFTFQAASWNVCNFLYLLVIHHVTFEKLKEFHKMAIEAPTKCRQPFITKWS